jgi:acetolactate synthase-1/2/3 large subunit
MTKTIADALVEALAQAGVRRMFGIPGGGSSLDVMEAGAKIGIDFVLARTESAAAMMAAATAELSGAPGVILTGLGPGAANATNGVAYAQLDRAPLLIVTDRFDDAESYVTHQAVAHDRLFGAVVKASRTLRAGDGVADAAALLRLAMAHPQGAVHIDLSSKQAGSPAGAHATTPAAPESGPDDASLAKARSLLASARKPAILVGVQAREDAAAVRNFAAALNCPVFVTFKAKGIVSDDDPLTIGLVTGGTAEAPCLAEADLHILYGFDPIELIPQRWRFKAPIIELGRVQGLAHYKAPDVSLIGPRAASVAALGGANRASSWTVEDLARHKAAYRARIAPHRSRDGLGAVEVVEAAQRAAPKDTRMTVDAGAHMFAAMTLWRARETNGALISNGLSTMGLSLPAAIASALHEPLRPVVAFTGDGGLMMCLGELATAAERGCRIAVVVLNDAALSLIDVKQQKRGLPARGVRYPRADFAQVARALGCRGAVATTAGQLEAAVAEALAGSGPTLIDAHVDPAPYSAHVDALRA